MSISIEVFDDSKHYGWLRGGIGFEGIFMLATPILAIVVYVLVATGVLSFMHALALYAALVAQPHFVATYTRTAFSKQQLLNHKFEMLALPLLVMAVLVGLYATFGIWIYMSLYLYVQWFHFLRQSYGIARMYRANQYSPLQMNLQLTVPFTVLLFGELFSGLLWRLLHILHFLLNFSIYQIF